MILITGATGKMGSKVVETLLSKNMPANEIAVLVRDENKASDLKDKGLHIFIGDYDDTASLNNAMKDVEKVLLVSGTDVNKLVEQHKNVIDAAKKAGVKCIAYTGNCLRDRDTLENRIMITHFETEDYIIASGLNYIIFRNVLYMDSMAMFMLGKDFRQHGIQLPAGEGKVSYALRSDEAEAIGNVLAGNNCSNRIYNFTGTKAYSFNDVATTLSELMDNEINYTAIDIETYKNKALQNGVPEHAVEMMAPFFADIKNGQGSIVTNDLENALGRTPVDLKTGLKLLLNL